MTDTPFVRFCDIPDARAGDLLLAEFKGRPVRVVYLTTDEHAWCFFDEYDRRTCAETSVTGWEVKQNCDSVRVLHRLRGVARADLADDRWPDTERRLRESTDTGAPTIAFTIARAGDPGPDDGVTTITMPGSPPRVGQRVRFGDLRSGEVGRDATDYGARLDDRWCWVALVGAPVDPDDECWSDLDVWGGALCPDEEVEIIAEGCTTPADVRRVVEAREGVVAPEPEPKPEWRVGQEVTAAEAARLPVGAVMSDSPRTGFDVRLSGGWHACGWGSNLDDKINLHSGSGVRGKILALLDPADLTSRRSIVEALARAGHQPAVERLAAERSAPRTWKVGDEVTPEQTATLPPGVVLTDVPFYVTCRLDDGTWRDTCIVGEWLKNPKPLPAGGAAHSTGHPRRIIGLDVPRGVTRREVAKALAAQGYQPAVDALAALRAAEQPAPAKPEPPAPAKPRTLADVEPGTLALTRDGVWVYRLPNGKGWGLGDGGDLTWRRLVVDGKADGWSWSGGATRREVVREIPNVKPSDLAPGAWERLIGEAPAVAPTPEPLKLGAVVAQPLKVGDAVPASRRDELPVGAVLAQDTQGYYVRRASGGWQCAAFTVHEPDAPLGSIERTPNPHPRDGARLVALDCTAEDRAGLALQLASRGVEPAREWLQRNADHPLVKAATAKVEQATANTRAALDAQRPALKVGDVVPAGRGGDVPEWACVQNGEVRGVLRRVGDLWQTVDFIGRRPADTLLLPGVEHHVAEGKRIIALGCDAADRTGLALQLAAHGWQPARDWLRQHGLDAAPTPSGDPIARATAALLKVGDEARKWTDLPSGAVVENRHKNVALVRDGEFGWLRVWRGEWDNSPAWNRCSAWDHDGQLPVRVVALGPPDCTPAQARTLYEAATAPPAPPITITTGLTITGDPAGFAAAVHTALQQPAPKAVAAAEPPPLPAPGEVVTPEVLDLLPVGAVVDSRDGSGIPWAIKCADGWDWITTSTLTTGERYWSADERWSARLRRSVLVALDAPPPGAELRAWCSARGYKRALWVESQLTSHPVSKPTLDAAPATRHAEDMATQLSAVTVTTPAGVFVQQAGEDAAQFALRVANATTQKALAAQDVSKVPAQQAAQPSALARIGDTLKSIGLDFVQDGVKAAVDGKALVMVDGGRMVAHKAIVAAAEAAGGEAAAVKALRVAQHPATILVEDALLAIGASLTGRQGFAAVVRQRVMRRLVDGAGDVVVNKGAAVVTQLAQAAGMLGAAVAAAELPEQAATEGEVVS